MESCSNVEEINNMHEIWLKPPHFLSSSKPDTLACPNWSPFSEVIQTGKMKDVAALCCFSTHLHHFNIEIQMFY